MMTNEQLAEAVARVKELDAENRQTVFPDKVRLEMAAIIAQQDAIIQQQRDVMRMARDDLLWLEVCLSKWPGEKITPMRAALDYIKRRSPAIDAALKGSE